MNSSQVVLINEDRYHVKVTNPCTLANQVVAKTLGPIDYWIKDTAATVTFTSFDDWTTANYGNQVRTPSDFSTGADLCGPKTYQLYKTYPDRFSAELHDATTQPWISLTYSAPKHVLSVQTSDPKYKTNAYVTFWVKVSLDNYSILNPINAVRWEPV